MNDQTLARSDLSADDVVGAFPSLVAAREGMSRLGRAGVDADRVSLLGRNAEEAATDPDTRGRDQRVTEATGRRATTGVVVGALAAAAIALGVFALVGSGTRAVWAGVLVAAVAGALLGGFIRAVALTDQTDDWEVTYDPEDRGEVLVAVRAGSAEEGDKALELLADAGTTQTYRVGDRRR